MIIQNVIHAPFVVRGNFSLTAQYHVGDIVRYNVSGTSTAWILLLPAPIGTFPSQVSLFWGSLIETILSATGPAGAAAPQLQSQYSTDGTTWRNTYVTGDTYTRTSADGGTTWSPALRFLGDPGIAGRDGQDGQDGRDGRDGQDGLDGVGTPGQDGNDGDSVEIQFSSDNTNWHDTLDTGLDAYIRFRTGSAAWSDGVRFKGIQGDPGRAGTSIFVEFSPDNTLNSWHDDLALTDQYIRIWNDGSAPPADGILFKGEGQVVDIQYSLDGVAWHNTAAANDEYIRFRKGQEPWTIPLYFAGGSGGGGGGGTSLQQASSQEILEAIETDPRSYAPSQVPEMVQDHETYPWAHSQEIIYSRTPSPGVLTFQFVDVGARRYIQFNDLDTMSHFGLYLNELEIHDEFALVTVADKTEMYRGEFDEDYDEANTRIAVLNIPDNTPLLVNGVAYLIEFTRSIPDIGITVAEGQDQVFEIVEPFAFARVRNIQSGLLEPNPDNPNPIPLDRRYANLPIIWEREDTEVEYFEPTTTPLSSTNLQIKIETISNEKYIQVQTTGAGAAFLETLKKYDIVGIYESGTNDFQAFLIAEADWDTTNGLHVREIFNDLSSPDDYETGTGTFQILRHTRAAALGALEYQYSPDRADANFHDPPVVATDFYGRWRAAGATVWGEAFALVDTTAGATAFHHVPPANVAGTADLVTLTIPGITAYTEGLQVGFQFPGVVNNPSPEIQINALGARLYVKNTDLLSFGLGELEPDSYIRLVYVSGADKFISNIPSDYHTVFVLSSGVTQTGDEITLQPTFTPGSSSSIAYKFVPQATNTGNVTIDVRDIGIGRKSLRKQDGSEFAAGELPVGYLLAVVYDVTNNYYWTGNYNGPVTGGTGTSNIHKVLPAGVTGTADAIELAITGVTTYTDGMEVQFFAEHTNTAGVTVQIGALGAKDLVKEDLSAFGAGQIITSHFIRAIYDATNDQFIANIAPPPTATPATANIHKVLPAQVTGTANAIQVAISGVTAYTDGLEIQFFAEHDNTDAVTLQVNTLGAKGMTKEDNEPFATGELEDGYYIEAVYDSTDDDFVTNVVPVSTSSRGRRTWTPRIPTDVGDIVYDAEANQDYRCIIADNGLGEPPFNNDNFLGLDARRIIRGTRSTPHSASQNLSFETTIIAGGVATQFANVDFAISSGADSHIDYDASTHTGTVLSDELTLTGGSLTISDNLFGILNQSGAEIADMRIEVGLYNVANNTYHRIAETGPITIPAGTIFPNAVFTDVGDVNLQLTQGQQFRPYIAATSNRTFIADQTDGAIRAENAESTLTFAYTYTFGNQTHIDVGYGIDAQGDLVGIAEDGSENEIVTSTGRSRGNLRDEIRQHLHGFAVIYARYESREQVPDEITGITYTADTNGDYSFAFPSPWTENPSSLLPGGFHYQAIIFGYASEVTRSSAPFEIATETEIHSEQLARFYQEAHGAHVLSDLTALPNLGGINAGKALNGEANVELCTVRYWDAEGGRFIEDYNNITHLRGNQSLSAAFTFNVDRNYSHLIFEISAGVAASIMVSGTDVNGDAVTETIDFEPTVTRQVSVNVYDFGSVITFTPTGFTNETVNISAYEWVEQMIESNRYGVISQSDIAETGTRLLIEHGSTDIPGDIDVYVHQFAGQGIGTDTFPNAIRVTNQNRTGHGRLATISADFQFRWSYLLPDGTPGVEGIGKAGWETTVATQTDDDYVAVAEGVLLGADGELELTDENGFPVIATLDPDGIRTETVTTAVAQPYSVYEYFTLFVSRNGNPRSAFFGMNSNRQVHNYTPTATNVFEFAFSIENGVLGTVLFARNPSQTAVDDFADIHGDRNQLNTIAGRLYNTKGDLNASDVIDIISEALGSDITMYAPIVVSGNTPTADTAQTDHAQVWVADHTRTGTATYTAIYTSIVGTDDWVESIKFYGKRIREYADNIQFFEDEFVREDENLYVVLSDYSGTDSPKDNSAVFRPLEALILSAPEQIISNIPIRYHSRSGNPFDFANYTPTIGTPGLENHITIGADDGIISPTEVATANFPAVATGGFTVQIRNYGSNPVTHAQGAYRLIALTSHDIFNPVRWLESEPIVIPANSVETVEFTGTAQTLTTDGVSELELRFVDANIPTLHAIPTAMSNFEFDLTLRQVDADALTTNAGGELVIHDRKRGVVYPFANTRGLLGEFRDFNFPPWQPANYPENQVVTYAFSPYISTTDIVPADADPITQSDKWRPLSVPPNSFTVTPFKFDAYLATFHGTARALLGVSFFTRDRIPDPYDPVTVNSIGKYMQVIAKKRIIELKMNAFLGNVTAKNHTLSDIVVNSVTFHADVVRNGESTAEANSQQTVAPTITTFPLTVPARDVTVQNSGEARIQIRRTASDTEVVFTDLEIGDTVRFFIDTDPVGDTDLDFSINGFQFGFAIEGEIEHPHGRETLIETADDSNARSLWISMTQDQYDNSSKMVLTLEDLDRNAGNIWQETVDVDMVGLRSIGRRITTYPTAADPTDFFRIHIGNTFHAIHSPTNRTFAFYDDDVTATTPTGALRRLDTLNPIGNNHTFNNFEGGFTYVPELGEFVIHRSSHGGLFAVDVSNGRLSTITTNQWGGSAFQNPRGLEYHPELDSFLITYFDQPQNVYFIAQIRRSDYSYQGRWGTTTPHVLSGLTRHDGTYYVIREDPTGDTYLDRIDQAGVRTQVGATNPDNIRNSAIMYDERAGADRIIAIPQAGQNMFTIDPTNADVVEVSGTIINFGLGGTLPNIKGLALASPHHAYCVGSADNTLYELVYPQHGTRKIRTAYLTR